MKQRLRYCYYECKKAVKALPQMITGAIVLVVMTGAIAFCGMQLLSQHPDIISVPVGLVVSENSENMDFVIDFLSSMESTENGFTFRIMEETAAYRALENGTVSAVMILPDQVLTGIMNGTNEHVQVLLSRKNALSAILLQELSLAGATLLTSAQAGTYTMTELFIRQGLGAALPNAYAELDLRNLRYALVRGDVFLTKAVSTTGSTSLTIYYLSTAVLFFLLMSGIPLLSFYRIPSQVLRMKLKSSGISTFSQGISRYCSIVVIFIIYLLTFLFATAALFSLRLLPWFFPPESWLLLLILLFPVTAFLYMIYELGRTPAISLILLFLTGILLMLLSGCFIPLSFFPPFWRTLAEYLPTTTMMRQLFHLFSCLIHTDDLYPQLLDRTGLILLLWGLLFLTAGSLISVYRGRCDR